ncbi:MAG: hypothetical protein E6K13_02795 [Methanobacteriota archaeon]|nr:MAG: hypothetical protein E6K13_02795 [Euryarchaeota archaeon]
MPSHLPGFKSRSPHSGSSSHDVRATVKTKRPHARGVPALKDIGERQAVKALLRIFDRGHPVGLGHDVGVVDWGDDYLVVTTDAINARTHVPAGAAPTQIGWYVVAVNLSDIAASGALPLGFVAALALPRARGPGPAGGGT